MRSNGTGRFICYEQVKKNSVFDNNEIDCAYFNIRRYVRNYASYEGKKFRGDDIAKTEEPVELAEEENEAILRSLIQKLMWCSQGDMKDMLYLLMKDRDKAWDRKELEHFVNSHIVNSHKKYPCLDRFKVKFSYRTNCNYQGYLHFVKEGAMWGAKLGFPFWLITLGGPALSKLIEIRFCEKKVFADVAVDNELYAGVADVIDKYFQKIAEDMEGIVQDRAIAINNNLCGHVKGLVRDSVGYNWYEEFAIGAPNCIIYLLSLVAFVGGGLCVADSSLILMRGERNRAKIGSFVLTVFCVNAVLFWWFGEGIEDQSLFVPTLIGLTAYSMALGAAINVHNKIFFDDGSTHQKSCELSEIKAQLERKDIEIF